jgi:hypothetical protein
MKPILVLLLTFVAIGCEKAINPTDNNPPVVKNPPQDTSCVCYEIYAPVCGDNGITYPNDCYASCAGVQYTDGKCTPQNGSGKVQWTGPVAVDGCEWMILLENGDQVKPDNLDPLLQVDGLDITFRFRILDYPFRCGIAGSSFPRYELVEANKAK